MIPQKHLPPSQQIKEEFPKTAQPSPQDYVDLFEDAKEKGDSIVYLSLSSSLSGTFQSATLAKSMVEYDEILPEYDFASNKGYGTKAHIEGLHQYGPTPIHRMTFIKKYVE